jgi:hypothetical protein
VCVDVVLQRPSVRPIYERSFPLGRWEQQILWSLHLCQWPADWARASNVGILPRLTTVLAFDESTSRNSVAGASGLVLYGTVLAEGHFDLHHRS